MKLKLKTDWRQSTHLSIQRKVCDFVHDQCNSMDLLLHDNAISKLLPANSPTTWSTLAPTFTKRVTSVGICGPPSCFQCQPFISKYDDHLLKTTSKYRQEVLNTVEHYNLHATLKWAAIPDNQQWPSSLSACHSPRNCCTSHTNDH